VEKLTGLQNTLISLNNANINLNEKIGKSRISKDELAQK